MVDLFVFDVLEDIRGDLIYCLMILRLTGVAPLEADHELIEVYVIGYAHNNFPVSLGAVQARLSPARQC